MRIAAPLALLALTPLGVAQPYTVGVFDAKLTGGTGASSAGFLEVFEDMPEYDAEPLSDLDLGALYGYDVLILYDLHEAGSVAPGWKANVSQFAQAGGSILSIYHQHLFSQVGAGILKVRVPEVGPVGEGPLVEGLSQFKTDWSDHIILNGGPQGKTFLENTEGQPVAAHGALGKGKLISCGLALGIERDWQTSKPPEGMERQLLVNMLRWLQPEQRWPERLAAYAVHAELKTWLETAYVRQPSEAVLRIKGVVPKAGETGAVDITVTDAEGGELTSQAIWTAKPAPEAEVGIIDERINVPTEGLAAGPAHVKRILKVGGRILDSASPTQLVRSEPPEQEFRAFWTHAFDDRLPEDIMPRIRACGFNAVVPRTSGGTGAFYLSKVLPDVQNILGEEDWLENCIRHAHANGLQVHPYRNCFVMEGRASDETIAAFREAGQLQVAPDGRPLGWACPSQEVNRELEVTAALDIVANYDVDGFQFDFIRYPSADGCFCERCREKFEQEHGAQVEDWPKDALAKGAIFTEYTAFRQAQITETVRMVSEAIRRAKPNVRISAAVFRDYATDSVAVGQDWVTWAEEGYIDFLCPMDYTEDPTKLDGWVRDQVALVGDKIPVCAGLGLASSSSAMETPEDMALQIDIARQAGAKGFVLFAWRPGCDEKIVLPQRDDCLAGTPSIPW